MGGIHMINMEQTQMKKAKNFFENEYKERGMVKWQGYYLSDHTKDVSEYTHKRLNIMNQALMPEMTQEDISKVLYNAYANNKAVNVQEKEIIDGIVPSIISGVVKGYNENYVFIGGAKINIEDINWTEEK